MSTRALAAIGVVVGVLAGAHPAWADNVVNDVNASGNGTIAAGGSTTVGYKVNGTGGDGCNAADGTALTLTVNVPAAVTASTSSLQFTACNDFKFVTFTSNTVGSHAVTVAFADAGGTGDYRNQADFTLRVTGAANTAPTVTVGGVAHGASYEFGTVPAARCSATDTEDGASSFAAGLGAVTGPRSAAGLGSRTASCSYTDGGGLTATASATFAIVDTTGPVVTPPADTTAEAASASGAPVAFAAATAHDAVDGDRSTACSPASGALFALGATTVTCTATDIAGNTGASTFTVTVVDTTAPTVHAPTSVVAAATSASGAPVTFAAATAHDAVDGDLPASCSRLSGSTFPLGTTTVTCSATDAARNTGSGFFTVTVQDEAAPVVTPPADTTVEATSASGAPVTFAAATAHDAVDGDLPASCSPASGSTFALGTTTVTCSATDAAGNRGSSTFDVTVRDTTAPDFAAPSDLVEEATSAAGADIDYTSPSASDAVDGPTAVQCAPVAGAFPLGTTTVTCTAADIAGNTRTKTFTVTVRDTTAPSVTPPADLTEEATSGAGAVVAYGDASADDIVDGGLPASCSPASGSTFALGTTTVTCSATDAAGNTGSSTFDVTVRDTTGPAVTVPANMAAEAMSAAGAAVAYSGVSAADLVDGAVAVQCAPASGATFPLGTTTVACTASDNRGNPGTGSFTITVVDSTAPLVTVPATVTAEAGSASGAPVSYSGVSAADAVDGAVAVNCSPASGSAYSLGTTTVTCSATDAAGNTGINGFDVQVVDTTAPALTVPGPRSATASSSAGAPVSFTTGAIDIVDGPVRPACDHASGSTFAVGTTTVTCRATDAAGNTATKTFLVTVAYGWSGVLQPVNADGSSAFKLGSTVPVKFRLTGASAGITDAVARLLVAKVSEGTAGSEAEAVSTAAATSGNVFRYDASGDLYVFNLASKGLTAGVHLLRIDLGDGSTRAVPITLKK